MMRNDLRGVIVAGLNQSAARMSAPGADVLAGLTCAATTHHPVQPKTREQIWSDFQHALAVIDAMPKPAFALPTVQVIASPHMPETTPKYHKQPRKWVRRQVFEPSREFDLTHIRDDMQIIACEGAIYTHPANVAKITAQLAAQGGRP